MTLTRLAFFKLLAAVGIGQATKTQPTQPSGRVVNGCEPDEPQAATHCFFNGPLFFEGDKCKEGESRCPIGHCQKPRFANPPLIEIESGPNGLWPNERAKIVVCSVCGVVYAPQDKESK